MYLISIHHSQICKTTALAGEPLEPVPEGCQRKGAKSSFAHNPVLSQVPIYAVTYEPSIGNLDVMYGISH